VTVAFLTEDCFFIAKVVIKEDVVQRNILKTVPTARIIPAENLTACLRMLLTLKLRLKK
jgi:hypothetical protein